MICINLIYLKSNSKNYNNKVTITNLLNEILSILKTTNYFA